MKHVPKLTIKTIEHHDVALVSLLITLNTFHTSVSTADFDHMVIIRWEFEPTYHSGGVLLLLNNECISRCDIPKFIKQIIASKATEENLKI